MSVMITSDEIYDYFGRLGSGLQLPDTTYFVPAREWLFGDFKQWYISKLWKLGLWDMGEGKWKDNFDCDDFARVFATLASICNGVLRGSKPEGLAVGEVFYDIDGDPDRGHAINCAFVDNKELIFIEPQEVREIKLSKPELKSIEFVRF